MTIEAERTTREGFFGQAWLVLLLALCFGGGLAAVEIGLGPRIEANKRAEIFSQIPQLVPGADEERSAELRPGIYEAKTTDGDRAGWVLRASGQGFADRIELLIGLAPSAETLTGLYVLDQKETPGLGDYITDRERFRKWFEGQPATAPLRVVKQAKAPPAAEVQALTGATISSQAVADIVNERVRGFRAELAAGDVKASGASTHGKEGPR